MDAVMKKPFKNRVKGCPDAYKDLASALRVVEGGDRSVPSQAVAVYKESSLKSKHVSRSRRVVRRIFLQPDT
jgi:hypothetical protein